MIELAKRVVACKNWRWMSGMLLMSDPEKGPCGTELPNWSVNLRVRVTDAPDNRWEGVAQYSAEYPDANFVTVLHNELPNPLPDLTDPATMGCLLALVREATGDAEASCMFYGGRWYCHWHANETIAETEPEALLLAIKEATT